MLTEHTTRDGQRSGWTGLKPNTRPTQNSPVVIYQTNTNQIINKLDKPNRFRLDWKSC